MVETIQHLIDYTRSLLFSGGETIDRNVDTACIMKYGVLRKLLVHMLRILHNPASKVTPDE